MREDKLFICCCDVRFKGGGSLSAEDWFDFCQRSGQFRPNSVARQLRSWFYDSHKAAAGLRSVAKLQDDRRNQVWLHFD